MGTEPRVHIDTAIKMRYRQVEIAKARIAASTGWQVTQEDIKFIMKVTHELRRVRERS